MSRQWRWCIKVVPDIGSCNVGVLSVLAYHWTSSWSLHSKVSKFSTEKFSWSCISDLEVLFHLFCDPQNWCPWKLFPFLVYPMWPLFLKQINGCRVQLCQSILYKVCFTDSRWPRVQQTNVQSQVQYNSAFLTPLWKSMFYILDEICFFQWAKPGHFF